MITTLPRWQQRGIALGILGIAFLGLTVGAVVPLADSWRSDIRWETRTIHDIGRERGLLAQRGELERVQAALALSPVDQRVLAGTPQAAAAQLQANLRSFLDPAATLQSVQPVAPREEGRFQRVSIQVSLTATMDQLTEFLERMAHAPGVYTVDNVQISAPENQDKTVNAPLNVRFDLSGYLVAKSMAP